MSLLFRATVDARQGFHHFAPELLFKRQFHTLHVAKLIFSLFICRLFDLRKNCFSISFHKIDAIFPDFGEPEF